MTQAHRRKFGAGQVRDRALRNPPWASSLISEGAGLVIAGPALVGVVIVGAGLGVEAWFLGLAVVLIAISCMVIGLLLALANLIGHHTPSPT